MWSDVLGRARSQQAENFSSENIGPETGFAEVLGSHATPLSIDILIVLRSAFSLVFGGDVHSFPFEKDQ